jgi:hypothetical protein
LQNNDAGIGLGSFGLGDFLGGHEQWCAYKEDTGSMDTQMNAPVLSVDLNLTNSTVVVVVGGGAIEKRSTTTITRRSFQRTATEMSAVSLAHPLSHKKCNYSAWGLHHIPRSYGHFLYIFKCTFGVH